MTNRRLSAQCVQQLATLDSPFLQENDDLVRDAVEFPHAVMMLFAGHLTRQFADAERRDRLVIEQDNIITGVLAVLEDWLRTGDSDVRTLITDSFIEQVYDLNLWLFEHLLGRAG